MATTRTKWLALLGSALIGAASAAFAQDSGPLIDLLVKKGLVNDQEAENLRAELVKDFAANTSAGKLDLSSRVQRFTLAGDVRVRYQYDNETQNTTTATSVTEPVQTNPNNDRSRYRYRFRFGPTVALTNNWITGLRLETANSSTSTNDDFGAPGSTNFAKDANTAYIGQVWIQYAATNKLGADRVDFRIGKYAHPFFNPGVNGFWIDTDINPEGLSEEFVFNNIFSKWSLAVRGGQYLLANNARAAGRVAPFLNTPSMLYIAQAELSNTHIFESNVYGIRIAPGFVAFSGQENNSMTLNQADTSTTSNYDNLFTLLMPVEYTFKVLNQPLAVYGTYGLNLHGAKRSDFLYSTSATSESPVFTSAAGDPSAYNQMFNFGLRFGGSRNPGDLQVTAEYRFIEPGAYSAILLDSDYNGGRTNGAGAILSVAYNWTDAVFSTVTFFHAENIDKNSIGAVGYHKADVLQIDFSAKF